MSDQKEGFEEMGDPNISAGNSQDAAIRMIANNIHRLNEAVTKAVDAGVTVEFMRTARYHHEGNWGDQMTPIIRTNK